MMRFRQIFRLLPALTLGCWLGSAYAQQPTPQAESALAPAGKKVFHPEAVMQLTSSRTVIEQLAQERASQINQQLYKNGLQQRTFSNEGTSSVAGVVDSLGHAGVTSLRDVVKMTGGLVATALTEGGGAAGRQFYDQTASFVLSVPVQLNELQSLLALADRQGEIMLIGHAIVYAATPMLAGRIVGATVRAGIIIKRGGAIESVALSELSENGSMMKSGQVGIVRLDPVESSAARTIMTPDGPVKVGYDPLAAELDHVLNHPAEFPSPKGGPKGEGNGLAGGFNESLSRGPGRSLRGQPLKPSGAGGTATLEAPTSIKVTANSTPRLTTPANGPLAQLKTSPPAAPKITVKPNIDFPDVVPVVGLPNSKPVGEKDDPKAPSMPSKEEIDQRRYNAAVPFEWHIFYSKEDWLADGCPTNVDEIRRHILARQASASGSGSGGQTGGNKSLSTAFDPQKGPTPIYKGSLSLLDLFRQTTLRYHNAKPGDLLMEGVLPFLLRKLVHAEAANITIKDPEGDLHITNLEFIRLGERLQLVSDVTDSGGETLRALLTFELSGHDFDVQVSIFPKGKVSDSVSFSKPLSDIIINGEFFIDIEALPPVAGMRELSLQQQASLELQNGDLHVDAMLRERGQERLYPKDLESALGIKLRPNQDVVAMTTKPGFTHTSVADGMSGMSYYNGHWVAIQAQRFVHAYFDHFVTPALRNSGDLQAIRQAVIQLVRAANNHVYHLFSEIGIGNTETHGTTLIGAFTLADQRVIIYSVGDSQAAVVPADPHQPVLYTSPHSVFERAIHKHGYDRRTMLDVRMVDEEDRIPEPVQPGIESRSKEFLGDFIIGALGNIIFVENDVMVTVVTLNSGDTLFLYSDGLPKALNILPTNPTATPLPQEIAAVHAEDLGKTEYGRANRLLNFLSEPHVIPSTLLFGPGFTGTDIDDLSLVRLRRGCARPSQLPVLHTLELSGELADLATPIGAGIPTGTSLQENFDDIFDVIVAYLQSGHLFEANSEMTELPVNCLPDIYRKRRELDKPEKDMLASLEATMGLRRMQAAATALTATQLEELFVHSQNAAAKAWLQGVGVTSFAALDDYMTRESARLGVDKMSTAAWQALATSNAATDARMHEAFARIVTPEEMQETFDADLQQCLDNLQRQEWKKARQRLVEYARRTTGGDTIGDRQMETLFQKSPHRQAVQDRFGIPTYLGFELFVQLNYLRYRTYKEGEAAAYLEQFKAARRTYVAGEAINITYDSGDASRSVPASQEALVYKIDGCKKVAKLFLTESTPDLNGELRLARLQLELYTALKQFGFMNLPKNLQLVHLSVNGVDHIALAMDFYEGEHFDEEDMVSLGHPLRDEAVERFENPLYRNDVATMLAVMRQHELRIAELQFIATTSRLVLIDPFDLIIGNQPAVRLPQGADYASDLQSQHQHLETYLATLSASAPNPARTGSQQTDFDQDLQEALAAITSQKWAEAHEILLGHARLEAQRTWRTDAQMEEIYKTSSQRDVILQRFGIKTYQAFEELVTLNLARHRKFSDAEITGFMTRLKTHDSHVAGRLLNPPRVEADGTVVAATASGFVYLIENETQVAKVFHVHAQRGEPALTDSYRLHEEYARAYRQLSLYLGLQRLGLTNLPQHLRIVHVVLDGVDHFALAMEYIEGTFASVGSIVETAASAATFLRPAHLADIDTLITFLERHPASIHDLQIIISNDRWIVFDPADLFLGNFPTMVFVFSEMPLMRHSFKTESDNVDLLARLKEYRDFLTH